MTSSRFAVASMLVLAAAGCQCVVFQPGTSFRCDDGNSCPEGYFCTADGWCDALEADGGMGGGNGGGGGAGGSGGGGAVVLGACSQAWCWEHPSPWGEVELRSVFTVSANDTWVVGDNAAIFHWNGSKWQQATSAARDDLLDVWVSPDREVWAVGQFGKVVHLESGRFADRSRAGLMDALNGISGTSGTDFWVVGAGGTIAHHQAGTWTDAASTPTTAVYRDVSVADPTRVLVAGSVLQHMGGASFTAVPSPLASMSSVWVNPGGDAWIAGTGGGLYTSSGTVPASAAGWTLVTASTSEDITSLTGVPTGEVFYGAVNGVFARSATFSGSISAQPNITAVHATDPSNVWATTSIGQVLRRTLPGAQLSDQRQLVGVTSLDLNAISLAADGSAYAVGQNHVAMRRNAAGQWSTIPVEGAQTGSELFAVWSDSLEHAVAVGEDNVRLAVFDPNTSSFRRPVGFVPADDLKAVWGSGVNVFAGGDNGVMVRFDGTTWSSMSSPGSFTIEGIWGVAVDDFWVVGSGNEIHHWDGTAWSQENSGGSGSGLTAIAGASASEVYAVGSNGRVLKRGPTGSWTSENTGTSGSYESVAVADGVVMVVSSEGFSLRRDAAGTWTPLGTAVADQVQLLGISGATAKGFLAAGTGATVIRWTP